MEVISDFQQHIIIYVFNSTKNYLLHFVCEFRVQILVFSAKNDVIFGSFSQFALSLREEQMVSQ